MDTVAICGKCSETEEPTNDKEKVVEVEKQVDDEVTGDANKDGPVVETEEKEAEVKVSALLKLWNFTTFNIHIKIIQVFCHFKSYKVCFFLQCRYA